MRGKSGAIHRQPIDHQVDEVAKMEEENKRIRDEIDSMERRFT